MSDARAPRISAVLCTRDRSASLLAALASLRAQSLPADRYEIVVVDNGTAAMTRPPDSEGAAGAAPLRLLREPVAGLSRARNTGWRAARGAYVAFLDDDAQADARWLECIVSAFESCQPAPGCVAGKVAPLWQAPRPAWLSDELTGALSVVDWATERRWLGADEWVAGCNMAFPRALLEISGGFSEQLGRRGDKLLSMEEVDLCRRLARAGHRTLYDPAVLVGHTIPAARLRRSWMLRRVYWNGVSTARLELGERNLPPARRLAAGARSLLRPLCAGAGKRSRAFAQLCRFAGRLGYSFGLWGLAR